MGSSNVSGLRLSSELLEHSGVHMANPNMNLSQPTSQQRHNSSDGIVTLEWHCGCILCTKWEKGAADKVILIDLFLFALDNWPPSSIMLISGDVDFASTLHVGFVWDWPSVARGEGFVPLSKVLIPPRGGLAEIAGYTMGYHINDNPNGQNEEDTEGSPKQSYKRPLFYQRSGVNQLLDRVRDVVVLREKTPGSKWKFLVAVAPLFLPPPSNHHFSAFVADDRRAYIIHMDKSTMPAPFSDHHNWYVSTLSSLSAPDGVLPTHLYTYNHVLDGFSAVLSRSQLDELEKMPGKSIYPEDLSVSGVPIYFGHGNRSKETCDDNSLDPKEVAGKYVFCDYIDETSGVNTFKIDRAGAAGAIFSTDSGPFLEPDDFYIPIVAMTPKDGDLIKDYLIKTKNSTVDIKFQLTVLVYHAVVKAPSGMKVVVEPSTIAFTGKYSKARFDVTVEVDIGDAGPTSDYIVNYGYLSWNEVNGTHVVRSPIVAAYAP
ncbi:putative endonuclease or glycosyl hydrolase [Actinidia rufa]|uniref:Putative endonuclease or glycosyl hydrolase n=1 Tax=Actinidia rufa TaxID=165716 RepID=A0A7J0ETD6_9ERIC|nr:putative endonuclease or glycosyl hydrolase [Actinidia rufa]